MKNDDRDTAITSRKKSVIVTASAGAGKTTAMVSRVIDLIKTDDVPVSSIVMLTFAEAAAEEMKSRLTSDLLEEVKKASGEQKARLLRALDQLPLLHCSTIDSFCYSLVKSHFEYLELPPTVSLMDEDTAKAYRKKALKTTLDAFAAECITGDAADPENYFRFLTSFGTDEDEVLEENIEKLYDYAEMTKNGEEFLNASVELLSLPVNEHPSIKAFIHSVKEGAYLAAANLSSLDYDSDVSTPGVQKYYDIVKGNVSLFVDCEADLDSLATAANSMARLTSVGNIKDSYPDAYAQWERVRDLYNEWKESGFMVKGGLEALKSSSVKIVADNEKDAITVIELTKRFKETYQAIKKEEQVLDFSDVEHLALKLLTELPAVRQEIGCKHMTMDESQDLNCLQEELMSAVAADAGLFIVGDVKQSIFRFRNAQPKLFGDRLERGKNDPNADVLTFNENFRSSQAVLDFVNVVFRRLMTKDFGGLDYPMAIRGGEFEGNGEVVCAFYNSKEAPQEKPVLQSVYSVKKTVEELEREDNRKEAEWVRNRILELVHPPEGKTILRDTKENKETVLSYKDIAILSPVGMKTDSLQETVVECLRNAGIPLNVGGFVRDVENADVSSLVDFLRLLISPNDDYALLSVLRSDLFSFTVQEVSDIAKEQGETFAEKAQKRSETNLKLKEFYEYLRKYRFLMSSLSLYELVSQVVDERLRPIVPQREDGRAVLGQVLSFVETLKSGRQTDSIPEYIEFFDKYYNMELEGEIAERDAVTVMTMHKSKGLQFPVVFVIGTGKTIINSFENKTLVRMDDELGVCKKTSGENKDVLFEIFQQKKADELKEDCLRLLYVACTRAKNYLYITGSVPNDEEVTDVRKAQTYSQLIKYGIGENKQYIKDFADFPDADVKQSAEDAAPIDQGAVAKTAELLQKAFAAVYPHEKATETGIKYTVTAITAMKETGGSPPASKFFPSEETVKGTAYHTVMENIPFTLLSEAETAEVLKTFAAGGVITKEEAADISVKRLFAGVKRIADIVKDRTVYREKSFLLHLPAREAGVADIDDEVEVQGKIDLLAIGKEDAVIVDYKLSAYSRDKLIQKYSAQLSLYALAVQKSFGIQNIRKYIFVLGRNEVIEL